MIIVPNYRLRDHGLSSTECLIWSNLSDKYLLMFAGALRCWRGYRGVKKKRKRTTNSSSPAKYLGTTFKPQAIVSHTTHQVNVIEHAVWDSLPAHVEEGTGLVRGTILELQQVIWKLAGRRWPRGDKYGST